MGRWTWPRWGHLGFVSARTCCEILDLSLLSLSLFSPLTSDVTWRKGSLLSTFSTTAEGTYENGVRMQINASLHLACTKEQTGFAFLVLPALPRKHLSSAMRLSQTLTKQLVCNKTKLRLRKKGVPPKGERGEQSRDWGTARELR